uniref:Uncharacterized protein n=1 Tax=Homalodisca liturata TaxID=320908 RepID=A0A1B6ILF5_9HEMI
MPDKRKKARLAIGDEETARLLDDSQARIQRALQDLRGGFPGSDDRSQLGCGEFEDYQYIHYPDTNDVEQQEDECLDNSISLISLDMSKGPSESTSPSTYELHEFDPMWTPPEHRGHPRFCPAHHGYGPAQISDMDTIREEQPSEEDLVETLNNRNVDRELARDTVLLLQQVILDADRLLKKHAGQGVNQLWAGNTRQSR